MKKIWLFFFLFCLLVLFFLLKGPSHKGLTNGPIRPVVSKSILQIRSLLEKDLNKRKAERPAHVVNQTNYLPRDLQKFVIGENPSCEFKGDDREKFLTLAKLQDDPLTALFQAECFTNVLTDLIPDLHPSTLVKLFDSIEENALSTGVVATDGNFSYYHTLSKLRIASTVLAILKTISNPDAGQGDEPFTISSIEARKDQIISQISALIAEVDRSNPIEQQSKTDCTKLWAIAPAIYGGYLDYPQFDSELNYFVTKAEDALNGGEAFQENITTVSYCMQAVLDSISPIEPPIASPPVETLIKKIVQLTWHDTSMNQCMNITGFSSTIDTTKSEDTLRHESCVSYPPTFFGDFRMLQLLKRLSSTTQTMNSAKVP